VPWRLHVEPLEQRCLLSAANLVITVNSAGDDPSGPTAGVMTLRDALTAVNNDAGDTSSNPDVINFAIAGTPTIALAADLPGINHPVLLDGSTQAAVTVNGNGFQALVVHSTATVKDLTVAGGAVTVTGPSTLNVAVGSSFTTGTGATFTVEDGGTFDADIGTTVRVAGDLTAGDNTDVFAYGAFSVGGNFNGGVNSSLFSYSPSFAVSGNLSLGDGSSVFAYSPLGGGPGTFGVGGSFRVGAGSNVYDYDNTFAVAGDFVVGENSSVSAYDPGAGTGSGTGAFSVGGNFQAGAGSNVTEYVDSFAVTGNLTAGDFSSVSANDPSSFGGAGPGTFSVGGNFDTGADSSVFAYASSLSVSGTFTPGASSFVAEYGGFTLGGGFDQGSASYIFVGGTFGVAPGSTSTTNDGTIEVGSGGTLQVAGPSGTQPAADVTVAPGGTLLVDGGGSVTVQGSLTVEGTVTVGGTLASSGGSVVVVQERGQLSTQGAGQLDVQGTLLVWHNPADIAFGTPLGADQLDATANVPGTFTYTPAAGTVLPGGQGQVLTVTFTPTDTTDFSSANARVMIDVSGGAITPTVTVNAVDLVYGTALADGQLSGTASATVNGQTVTVPGTFRYTSAAGTVLGGGGYTEAVTFTPSDTTDYAAASATVTVNVARATPGVALGPVALTYGTALDDGQLSGSASWTVGGVATSVAGSFSFGSLAGTVLGGSTYSEPITFTPADTTDYVPASATVTVQVAPATPIVSVNPVGLVYGTALADGQLSGTASWTVGGQPVSVSGTFSFGSLAGKVLSAGSYTEAVTFTPSDTTDYTSASATVTVNVAAATPGVSLGPVALTYGTALDDGQLSGSASWTVGGIPTSVAGSFSFGSLGGTVLGPGTYSEPVTFTPADTTDYGRASATVTVQVAPATPIVSVSPVTLIYGTALADGQLSGTATWTVGGQPVSVSGTFSFGSLAGKVLSAGNYTEAVTFTPSDTTDYTAAPATVTVNVARATPGLLLGTVTLTYGTALADPQLPASAFWTVGGVPTKVPGNFSFGNLAGTVLGGGTHSEPITFTPADTTDYGPASATVTVQVAPAIPTVSVNPVNLVYGTALADGQLSGTATWTVGGQTVNVAGTFRYTSAAGTVLGAGAGQTEAVTFTPSDTTDYTSASVTVTVNVARATPGVSLGAVALTYGTALADGQLSGSASWTVGGVPTKVPGRFSFGNLAGTVLGGGSHSEPVTFTPADTTDYSPASAAVTVQVAPATPAVSVSPVTLTSGTALADGQLSGTATWTVAGQPVNVGGTFTFGSLAGKVLGPGTYTETVSFTPTDRTDYGPATTSVTVTITSTYGVLVLSDLRHPRKAGSAIPFQIELTTAGGRNVSSAAIAVTALGIGTGPVYNPRTALAVQAEGNSCPGNVFQFQGGKAPSYRYNLKTPKGLKAGNYWLFFKVQGDPVIHAVGFQVK
jgi:hypothetical protein